MCLISSGPHNCINQVVAQVKGRWDVGLQFRSKNCTTEIPKLGKGPVDPNHFKMIAGWGPGNFIDTHFVV